MWSLFCINGPLQLQETMLLIEFLFRNGLPLCDFQVESASERERLLLFKISELQTR